MIGVTYKKIERLGSNVIQLRLQINNINTLTMKEILKLECGL